MKFDLNRLMHCNLWYGLALLAALVAIPATATDSTSPASSVGKTSDSEIAVDIPDAVLRQAVEDELKKTSGDPITRDEMATLARLSVSGESVGIVRDLTGIEYAINLRSIYLPFGDLSELGPLADLALLEAVETGNNTLSDVSPLAGLTSLKNLVLYYSLISDISPLAGLTSLEYLHLRNNGISDVLPIADLGSLISLDLSDNAISDLSPLDGLNLLRWVRLTSNDVTDVSPLTGLATLELLQLGNNNISDVSPLAGLKALTRLELWNNDISNVSSLLGLTALAELDLRNNNITDVSSLVANDGLGDGDSVHLGGNPLSRISIETHIPSLVQRGVDVSFDEIYRLPEVEDVRLRDAVEARLSRYVTPDLATLVWLDASDLEIENLSGLEGAAGLRLLNLDRNRIMDIAPLAKLGSLRGLTLAHNLIEDWTPLGGMDSLEYLAVDGNSLLEVPPLPPSIRYLYMPHNSISDLGPLTSRRGLVELDLSTNAVVSLLPLTEQRNLKYLHVSGNQVADISPLNFESLRELHLHENAVEDLSPLLKSEELLLVNVRRNPLADGALAVLEVLRERRVTVLAGETVPYFPAAGGPREGFVRIVNHGDENGHVFIEAVDDAGVRAEPVRLRVLRRRAIHFDSADLEYGVAARRLDGIGPPTAGDWRLSVISALDVEVLSYIRTEDGFFTAMHDVVPDAMAPFFNPGDARQRSVLRTVNMEAEPAKWTTGGYDDRGRWSPMAGSMLVRPQHALTLTGEALEDMHGLGDGEGRWRLRVRGFPWFAMSLLENPTGHLTNLSTAPDNATPLADGRTMHRLPLFPVADGSREGIVRVINRSYSSGEVTIEAVDDAGARSGPVQVAVAPRRAVELSATDLEHGNVEKGLAGRLGVGEGDWRLEVVSELELMALSYVQTADGFLASLHDVAPVAEDGGHRVVFFKPGSNRWQVSKLRLVNDGERAASVRIAGIDDRGVDSGPVTLTAPAGSALTFTSAELETGSDRLAGSLGDGYGQWRLWVHSDEPIAVMSLLETSGGLLANMSTGTAD